MGSVDQHRSLSSESQPSKIVLDGDPDADLYEDDEKKENKETEISDQSEKLTDQEGDQNLLETPWTFYYDKKIVARTNYKDFESGLKTLGTFKTVEGFWRHYSWMKSADNLPKDYNIFLFRHNNVPAWETFPDGGMWIIKVRKGNGVITRLWEELCFAAIGELFEEPDVAGVMLSSRGRDDNLSVWNSDNSNPEVRFNLGEKLKEILNLDESTLFEYKFFKSAIRDGSSFRNAKPYVYAVQGTYLPAPILLSENTQII